MQRGNIADRADSMLVVRLDALPCSWGDRTVVGDDDVRERMTVRVVDRRLGKVFDAGFSVLLRLEDCERPLCVDGYLRDDQVVGLNVADTRTHRLLKRRVKLREQLEAYVRSAECSDVRTGCGQAQLVVDNVDIHLERAEGLLD